MEQFLPLIINLISGGVGGNIVGALIKKISLGPLGNTIAGILGGGVGGQLLGLLGIATPEATGVLDIQGILSQVGSGGAGGAVLLVIVGLIKSLIAKK